MTPMENKHNDTKLLVGIAGLVVAAAAGIVMLAELGDRSDTPQERARQQPVFERESVPPPPAPLPTITPASLTTTVPEPVAEGPVAEAETGFVIDPDDDFVARGLEAWGSREFARAAAYFMAEADARPDRAWTHYMIGLSLWKDGRPDEAEAAMEQAARLDPDSVRSRVNLARIRNETTDFEGALEASRAALAVDAEDPQALFLEGRSLFNLGLLDEAQASLAASLARDPDNGYAQNLQGLILIRQGRGADAVGVLERASEMLSDVAYVNNNLGMALELAGENLGAVMAYRRAAEIDPAHAKAVANLARLEPTVDETLPPSETPVESTLELAETVQPIEESTVPAEATESVEESVEVAAASEDPLP